jgi:hypothetical protein
MQRRFVSVFTVKPAIRLPVPRMQLNFTGMGSVVVDRITTLGPMGENVEIGLGFKVYVDAPSLDEALAQSAGLVGVVLNFMTLVGDMGIPLPRLELACDVTTGVRERDFCQDFYDLLPFQVSRGGFDPNILLGAIEKVGTTSSESERDRVLNAVRWYRAGILAQDPLERFIHYWIGLEYLNPILQDVLRVEDNPTVCPACGKRVVTPTVSGIREFICRALGDSEGKRVYKAIHDLRIETVHGKESLGELLRVAHTYENQTAALLKQAIMFVLKMEEWKQQPGIPGPPSLPLRVEVRTKLLDGDPEKLGPDGELPRLTAHISLTGITVDENGQVKYTLRHTIDEPHLGPGVKLNNQVEVMVYGEGIAEVSAHEG